MEYQHSPVTVDGIAERLGGLFTEEQAAALAVAIHDAARQIARDEHVVAMRDVATN